MRSFAMALALATGLLQAANGQNPVQLIADSNANLVAQADDVVLSTMRGDISISGLNASVNGLVTSAGAMSSLIAQISNGLSSQTSAAEAVSSSLSTRINAVSSSLSAQIDQTMMGFAANLSTGLSAQTSRSVEISDQLANVTSALNTTQSAMSATVSAILSRMTPTPPPGLPSSCRDLLDNFNASAPSGLYQIRPVGATAAVQVYCDNEHYGGGWTLVLKSNAGTFSRNPRGPYYLPDTQSMFNMLANPTSNTFMEHLTTPEFPYLTSGSPYYVASLNRGNTNGAARYTQSLGQSPVVRIDLKRNDGNRNSVGTYMQKLTNASSTFDYWQSLRDSRAWTNYTTRSYYVYGFGRDFFLAKDVPSFSPKTNSFIHYTCQDSTFGFWSTGAVTVGGEQVTWSKHAGLLGDGHCNQGNLWLLTLDPSDGRFRNDNIRQASVFIR